MSPQNCNQNVIFYCNRIVTYLLLLVKPFPKNFFGNFSRMCPAIYCAFLSIFTQNAGGVHSFDGPPPVTMPSLCHAALTSDWLRAVSVLLPFPLPRLQKSCAGQSPAQPFHKIFIRRELLLAEHLLQTGQLLKALLGGLLVEGKQLLGAVGEGPGQGGVAGLVE